MSSRKLAAAALAGSLVLGAGAALAQVGDSDPTTTIDDHSASAGAVGDLTDAVPDLTGEGSPAGGLLEDDTNFDEDTTLDDDTTDGETDGDEVTGGGEEGTDEEGDGEAKENHGHAVSAVAHATPSGPGKGQIVSEAARSDAVAPKAPKDDGDDDGEGTGEVERGAGHGGRGRH